MHITILTLFPQMFKTVFETSMIGRALKKGIITITYIDIRDFSIDKYKTVDDHPYGGGVGMVMKVDVADRAIQHAISLCPEKKPFIVLLDPQGKPYKQKDASSLSKKDHIILFCSHYEGVDERIRSLADAQISIGDYILTGGEIPAMVLVDSVVRLIPGVLGKRESAKDESFSDPHLLEYPQYTQPQTYKGMEVPQVLLSGNHKKILEWRKEQSIQSTSIRRPDLVSSSNKD